MILDEAEALLDPVSDIEGFMLACLVDASTGMVLASRKDQDGISLPAAAAGAADIANVLSRLTGELPVDGPEDVMVTFRQQLYVIRMVSPEPQILLLVILDRDRVNLAMAPPDPQLLCELRRMSQTSRFTRARQLTSTVLPGRRPDGYADQVTGRLRRIAAARSTGMLGVCLVDWDSGMSLGALGGGKYLDLDVAAAGNTEVIRAKMRTMESLRLDDAIEDILITLGKQYHLIRLLKNSRDEQGLFLYLVLERQKANLTLARHNLKRIEADLSV